MESKVKYAPFKVGDVIQVTGKPGTNGTLIYNELYEVVGLTAENTQEAFDSFAFAIQPIAVLNAFGEKVRPFLGKVSHVHNS